MCSAAEKKALIYVKRIWNSKTSSHKKKIKNHNAKCENRVIETMGVAIFHDINNFE
jgi:hypothetical protein